MAKKSTSDDDFNAALTARRHEGSHNNGLVMTALPTGSKKSLDELLAIPAGLQAITEVVAIDEVRDIPIDLIVRSAYQVRAIDESAIDDLVDSIRDTGGLVTPIVVRPLANGKYELIAGHTRHAACTRLGYATIKAVVRDLDDEAAGKALAADNLTRKDLTDFEIFKQLTVLFNHQFIKSNSEAGRLLGRTRQDVQRFMKYGKLPAEVIEFLERAPDLLGANSANDLVAFMEEGKTDAVIEGVSRLFDGLVKTQQAMLLWVQQHDRERTVATEFRITDSHGKISGKVSITAKGIRISGNGLDFVAIEQLLRKELPKCQLD